MNRIIFLVLRRMRAPLLALLVAYTISILGLTLIQGVDDQGQPWRMDFFHAFYFISYMATTIGFGEIPYEFSEGQRLWVIFSIYLTVIAWFYAIGAILSLVQDPTFQRAVTEGRFTRGVLQLREPFYLICGFGDAGKSLVRSLTEREMRAVVIDANQDAINELALKDYLVFVPGLTADARVPEYLNIGGLKHAKCAGVVALTDNEHVNLKIAITSKLLNPHLPVICRSETPDHAANMASFGTDHIINPFAIFANRLASALHSPGLFALHNWLTGVPYSQLSDPVYPPPLGTWIICGYGRFGKAMRARLEEQGIPTVIVEAEPKNRHCPLGTIVGRGTEAVTLREAMVNEAVGIVAGTENDANNLSIVMTARELNPDLFVILRQNLNANREIIKAFPADLVMHPNEIIAREVRVLLTLPLLARFLVLAGDQDNQWANEVASRILGVVGEVVPYVWSIDISQATAGAVFASISHQDPLRITHLCRDPRSRERRLACIPLMLLRGEEYFLMPDEDFTLQSEDSLLFCGGYGIASRMEWVLQNANALNYVVTGDENPAGYVWQWFNRRWGNTSRQ